MSLRDFTTTQLWTAYANPWSTVARVEILAELMRRGETA